MTPGVLIQGAAPQLPTSTDSVAFTAGGASTSQDLGTSKVFVTIYATGDCSIRAAAVATGQAATAGDFPLKADTHYSWRVTTATRYLSVRGRSASGTLYRAVTSG